MRFSIIAAATALVSAVMAQQAYPTAPIGTTVWTSGASVTVKWTLNPPAAKTGLTVSLFKGDPAHQTLVQDLGVGAPGGTSLQVTIPAKLPSDWYSLRIGDSYTHYFLIKGTGVAPTAPPAVVTTTVPATSSAPTSTSSGNSTLPSITSTSKAPTPTNGAMSVSSSGSMAMIAAVAAIAIYAL
ncbi:hypothetical protein BGZ83_008386 [Gryganskiella cystojenkinii]|nr:hypothetical protein BGZ83_008386 [Gryganskiella cystojenkinii]